MSNTIQDILEIRTDVISEVYEVVRTVGLHVKTASGARDCRLEVIRRAGQDAGHEVSVAVRDGSGVWRRDPSWESGTVRKSADESLAAAIEHISRKAAEIPAPQAAAPVPEVVSDEISPEILAVLSAAVAAFLGKKARIRGARPLRASTSSAWAQQGRASVQGSHYLNRG